MTRNFNRSKYHTAYYYRDTGTCQVPFITTHSNQRLETSEARTAPNGVKPFINPTAMTARNERYSPNAFRRWQGSSQYIDDRWGESPTYSTSMSSAASAASAISASIATERFYDQLTQVDLSETLVEAKQIARMGNLADTVYQMTKAAKGRFGLTKVISAGWMWANYGVKPIVNDMYQCLDLIDRQAKKPVQVKSGATHTFYFEALSNPLGQRGRGSVTTRLQASFTVGHFGGLSNMTSMDPAYIAWTALPWTFITDYVYNVGGYLRQMELRALFNTGFQNGTVSTRVSANGTVNSGLGDFNPGNFPCKKPYFDFASQSQSYETYSRTILGGLPPIMKPQFNLDLTSTRLLNVAAALGSLLEDADPYERKPRRRRT